MLVQARIAVAVVHLFTQGWLSVHCGCIFKRSGLWETDLPVKDPLGELKMNQ